MIKMLKLTKFILKIIISLTILLTVLFIFTYREKEALTESFRNRSGNEYVELSHGYTEYEIGGDPEGIPVVLVHGLSVAIYDWDNQYEFLINNGYRVLRYSHYGRGFSDRPYLVYNRELYLTQLDELIKIFFDGKVNLVGHSLGGAISTEYAVNYKDNVNKLVLISPVLFPARNSAGVKLIKIPLVGDYSALTILSPLLIKRADVLFSNSKLEKGDIYSGYFDSQTRIKGFSRSVKSLFRNNAMGDYSDSYSRIKEGSALLIWGTEDKSVPFKDIYKITRLNQGIEAKIYDSVGHSPNFEIPDTVNEEIDRFIKG